MSLPSGTVSFLFTDIEGSTRLWEAHPEAMRLALARHDAVLREVIEARQGYVFKTIGDAFCAAFHSAQEAADAAREAQERLAREPWPSSIVLRVRMALATGTAESRDGDYFGRVLNRVARLLALGHGGQTLVSSSTRDLLPAHILLQDLGLHELRDVTEPERVFQLGYDGCPESFPPLRARRGSVHNLPQQLTEFVGREPVVAAWVGQARERSRRLFTLTGVGGVGKTRAAMRIAEDLLADFPDGVWWCDLEQASAGDEAADRLALALQVTPQPSLPVREQLLRHLRERNALLVLDNVEQVVGGAALVRDLLAGAPQTVCLVTSRRTLELRGEAVWELAPMSAAESLDLFVQRASECRADFTLDDDNRADVLELCRRLEGIPLAIELAAARTVGMQPGQIVERLKERFRLLQSRSQELNERQRALRGAIDWSYNLLGEDDRVVFTQLSVFVGGFTLEEAEAVCDAFDVFESVLELRRQSLLRVEDDRRFVMLDSLREYAAEKLAQGPEGDAPVRLRHAQTFLRFARDRMARVRTPAEIEALRELQDRAGNFVAAIEWARGVRQGALAAELCLLLGSLRLRLGFARTALAHIQAGLDALAPDAPGDLRARLLLERAGLHHDFGEGAACAERALEAQAIFTDAGDRCGIAQAENMLGQAALSDRRLDEAAARFARARALFEQAGDTIGVAIALNNLGLALRRDRSGDADARTARLQQAGVHFQEALRIRQTVGDQRGLAETFNNLGVLAFEQGAFDASWGHYQEALTYERRLDNRNGIGIALANLGEVAGIRGEAARGIRLLLAAEAVLADAGSPLASEVQSMREALPLPDGWSEGSIEAERSALATRDTEGRCTWALSDSSL